LLLKTQIQYLLQKILGLENYLYVFSWFKIRTLKNDASENDFFHFLQFVKPGDTVLDIGANIGIMTYYMSKKIENGKVFSFEPIPVNINALRRIVSYFNLSNVHLMDMALGNYNGEVEMVLPVVDKVTKQGLSHVLSDEITTFNEGHRHTTKIYKLDSLNKISEQPISAIKMDVENFEYHVLEGAVDLINRDKPVIYCELWDNENRYKCFTFLVNLGYSVLIKLGDNLVPFDKDLHTTQNFFFVHE
jgi:FkbM family methyltransferase